MITSNRIVKLDMARTFAILCVVLCHCSEMIYTQQSVKVAELGISSRIFMFGTFTIGRLGVPIFLYLSGILLLKKTIDSDEDILSFIRIIYFHYLLSMRYGLYYISCMEYLY